MKEKTKEKIYLIPGLMTDHRIWEKLGSHLHEYELVHTQIPLSDDFDEIVHYLEEKITCEKINLLGFSLGGYIASYFAIKYPKKVKKLFLLASTPSATEEKDIKYRQNKLQDAKTKEFLPISMKKAQSLLEIQDENVASTIVNMFKDLGHKNFISQLSSTLNRKNLFEDLSSLQMPIKIFYSKNDRLLNHASMKNFIKKDHNFNIIVREGNSHNIALEAPKHLSAEIKLWMEDKPYKKNS